MNRLIDRTKHIRRGDPTLYRDKMRLTCDCGWVGETGVMKGSGTKTGEEIEADLEALFVGHLPESERVLYLLVDQRKVPFMDGAGKTEFLARGNFLMPIGKPCLLTKWEERDGVRWGYWLIPATGEHGELPIGEIRTADGQVHRLNTPA